MNDYPDYMTKYAIADCAAQVLSQAKDRNSPCRGPEYHGLRGFLSEQPVKVLRWLWQNGDHMDRHLVAARVLIWLGQDEARRKHTLERLKTAPKLNPDQETLTPIYMTVEGGVVQFVDALPDQFVLKVLDMDTEGADPSEVQPSPLDASHSCRITDFFGKFSAPG